jgi:hypothetical protein
MFNLWRGWPFPPQRGDWTRLQAHIQDVICAGDTTTYTWLLAWLAKGVQHPDRRAETAIALRGARGTGKSLFGHAYGSLFGQHFIHISHARHLVGHFNAHLEDAVVVFADEAFWAGDKTGEGALKTLITEATITIERKGRDPRVVPNVIHLIIASNSEWIVPAGLDERRFCVLDVSDRHRQDRAHFAALHHELDHGGRAAMLWDLLARDTSGVDLRTPPDTTALREQKVLSMPSHERWWFDKLMDGRLLPNRPWDDAILKADLHKDYRDTLDSVGAGHKATATELGILLNRLVPKGALRAFQRMVNGERKWHWQFPPLAECRRRFDELMKSAQPWPADTDEYDG